MQIIRPIAAHALFGANPRILGVETDSAYFNQFHRVRALVEYRHSGGDWTVATELETPVHDRRVYFDLTSLFPFAATPPVTVTKNATPSHTSAGEYRITLDELPGTDPVPIDTTSYTNYALGGAVGTVAARSHNNQFHLIENAVLGVTPTEREVSAATPLWLTWYAMSELGQFPDSPPRTTPTYRNVTLELDDGSTVQITVGDTTDNPTILRSRQGECYHIPVGYEQMNLDAHVPAGRWVLAYRVRIEAATDFTDAQNNPVFVQSQEYRFVIDHDSRFWEPRALVFENSRCGIDVVELRGKTQHTVRAESESYDAPELLDALPTDHRARTVGNTSRAAVTSSTGWRPRTEAVGWIADLLHSTRVWEWTPDREQLLPVRITSRQLRTHDDDRDLAALEITYEHEQNRGY